MSDTARKVYRVIELTRLIKSALESRFREVWVEGELSNVKRPGSGHVYFTIKDEQSQLSAVMFRGSLQRLPFQPRDGMRVQACGDIGVYEPRGSYQIIVRTMEEGGIGTLQARFEALKKKLQAEGLFESARKRPLPLLPRCIGIVTSASGAAIRDILNVIGRRFPNVRIVLAPVRVQGAGAAEEIAEAIGDLNRLGGVDVLIVGRGGGSLEDLWAFNEECVARAIAASALPVIAAVGHETDFTIADFTADLRAPTPSAAAELVVGRKDAFMSAMADYDRRLARALKQAVETARTRLAALRGSYVFREPGNLALRYRQRIETADRATRLALLDRVRDIRLRLDEAAIHMTHGVQLRRQRAGDRLERYRLQLRALDPRGVLRRGYTLTRAADGRLLMRAAEAVPGTRLHTEFSDGTVESTVTGEVES